VLFRRGPAFVIGAAGRIGADRQERLAGRKALMAGAGGNPAIAIQNNSSLP
jgi:hypothetical protein